MKATIFHCIFSVKSLTFIPFRPITKYYWHFVISYSDKQNSSFCYCTVSPLGDINKNFAIVERKVIFPISQILTRKWKRGLKWFAYLQVKSTLTRFAYLQVKSTLARSSSNENLKCWLAQKKEIRWKYFVNRWLGATTFSPTTFKLSTFSITIKRDYLYQVIVKLSIVFYTAMLSVGKLNVVRLSDIILIVVAPMVAHI
jgi:hypothetical protein